MQDKPTFTGGNKSFGAALNKTVEALWRHGLNPAGMPGWSESADGWVPPPVFDAESPFLPWSILSRGNGHVAIQVGTIYKSFGSLAEEDIFEIIDFDIEFELSDSTVIYLELDNLATPTITLKAGAAWDDFPSTFKLSTEGVVKAEKAFFRLWHAVVGEKPIGEIGKQYDGFYMKKTFRSNDLILGYGSYESDETHRHIAVPVLFPM